MQRTGRKYGQKRNGRDQPRKRLEHEILRSEADLQRFFGLM
jgi:hypothetical protein